MLIVKVFILSIVICQRRNPRHACPKMTREGRARKGRVRKGRGAGLGFRGPGGARLPRQQLALRWGRNWVAQWNFWLGLCASASGGAAQSASMFINGAPVKSSVDSSIITSVVKYPGFESRLVVKNRVQRISISKYSQICYRYMEAGPLVSEAASNRVSNGARLEGRTNLRSFYRTQLLTD